MISENVKTLIKELAAGNGFGEKVTLVAATKTRTPEEINEAIKAGITDIGENKVQEFRDKYDLVKGANRHFIGHLQTNKIKYLVGKTYLIHSVDRDELAAELAKRCEISGTVQDILIQINIGCEDSKGGYPLEEGYAAYKKIAAMEGLEVRGFMAMLPLSDDTALLSSLCDKMRALFEKTRDGGGKIDYLSMGMSGDWRLCMEHGSNMIRLGTAIFGARDYSK